MLRRFIMHNLLEIVIQRGTPVAPWRKTPPDEVRYRPMVKKGAPMQRRENYQPPPAVLRAMAEETRAAHYGIPEEACTLVVIGTAVYNSTRIRLLDVGAALRAITVESLLDVKFDATFTVELPPIKGFVREQLCKPTGPNHTCVWAHYLDGCGEVHKDEFGHPIWRRFVVEEMPKPTNHITLVVRHRDNKLFIISAHYGNESRKLPGTAGATMEDQLWWYDPATRSGHALVVMPDMVKRGEKRILNATRECPWKY
jgi:hypothetical protein